MKCIMMWFIGKQIINHQPAITFKRDDSSSVGYRFVTIVFSLPNVFIVLENFAL